MADNSKFVPPKGMRDWLPQETLLRQKLIRLIESHYQLYGFQPIDTPVMENIEVLQGKGGGENEKLMFKVMKRGDSLSRTAARFANPAQPEDTLDIINNSNVLDPADLGLRFDMTVPLARYYGNHMNDLPKPFRCYHIGPVWRADRPQRGRFREFYQCDIDIIGGISDSCEIELLLATDRVLKELNVGKFKIRVSDKRLLPTFLKAVGLEQFLIQKMVGIIDKRDKQSQEVCENEAKQYGDDGNRFRDWVNDLTVSAEKLDPSKFSSKNFKDGSPLGEDRNFINEFEEIASPIGRIIERVKQINENANVVFDPLLVRGFDYYTGPIFEINVEDKNFAFSIGGGGRYDGLIEKLGGPKSTPAVGLSLGFERILTILMERGGISNALQPRVYIVNDKSSEKDIQVLAETLRSHGIAVETGLEKKDKVKQLVAAQGNGLEYAITDFAPGAQTFKVRQLSNRQDTEMNAEQLKAVLQKL